jgi:hypothetical protein
MKYLIILLFLTGCSTVYYPKGDFGGRIQYFNSIGSPIVCYKCRKTTHFFKIDGNGRKICPECYRKIIK